ncbi:antigen-presenting glycoprotein CD1d-like [Chiroxiphia lanceolata]|uniref:antigen-presenting glycoprotein CD1d-like n=1 Tax=Chiroxiphia lanceolata TaxID=296741 RepID=UPI0013CF009D|nr:antigen-presenting glycoprotein CD1d-like [Chiroxiphia lanceolata]
MPPWDSMGKRLPAPHPLLALASSPLLVPWLHTSSSAGMQIPEVGAGVGAGAAKDKGGLGGAHRSLQPQGPVPQPLHFPCPSPPCQPLSHVGTFTIQLLHTSTFQNTSFVDTEGIGLLEDIKLGSLDKHTWDIHFCQPWVRPALPRSEWDTIDNMIKIYFHNVIHLSNEGAKQKDVPYPFVAQVMAGCKLYPNRTSRMFTYVGYNGQDFLSLDTDNATWTLSQDTDLARYIRAVLQNDTTLVEVLEAIFNNTCINAMEMFLSYGRAALERQELPVATVFARTPSPHQLLLVCHVTAFYPRPISVAWLRDGQEVPPGPQLNTSPVLPNADLTYQLSSVLAVAPQDGHSYACRVRHRSLGTRSLLVPWAPPHIAQGTQRWC